MQYFEINGGKKLSGEIEINGSKNATVAILAAVLINKGTTTLHNVPQIEEVNRWVEILESIGVKIERKGKTFKITPPKEIKIEDIDVAAAERTRSAIMMISSLSGNLNKYLTNALEIREYDISERDMDVLRGTIRSDIPVYFMHKVREPLTSKEKKEVEDELIKDFYALWREFYKNKNLVVKTVAVKRNKH